MSHATDHIGRSAVISGFAELPSAKSPEGLTSLGLTADIARRLIADAGLEKDEIDGLLVTTPFDSYSLYWPSVVGSNLGLSLGFFDTVELGGASSAGMVWRAAAAIEAGLCNHVLCIAAECIGGGGAGGNNWRTLLPASDAEFEMPFGATPPNAGYAMIARRHMHEFGTRPEDLAKIAVDQRKSALLAPGALFGNSAITIDDVLGSKLVCAPLHLLEIVSPCSGGSGVVVSRKSLLRKPEQQVVIRGAGEAGSHVSITERRDLTTSWARHSAARALAMAGVAATDVDIAQVYDCYTIAVLMFLEDIGFCAKGQGGAFVRERDLAWDGDFPCNTSGGQLSYGQAGSGGGMTIVVEGVRQLMHRAGARQVTNAELGIVHGNGGVMSDQVTLVFAN